RDPRPPAPARARWGPARGRGRGPSLRRGVHDRGRLAARRAGSGAGARGGRRHGGRDDRRAGDGVRGPDVRLRRGVALRRRRRGRRAEADDDLRAQDRELGVEPEPAGRDLTAVRLLVEAPLPGRTPLEVLHGVRHVDGLAIDTRLRERLVKDTTRGSDEGAACAILLIPRLLADEDDARLSLALAEHGPGPGLPEVAGAAMRRGLAVRPQARPLRELGVRVSGLQIIAGAGPRTPWVRGLFVTRHRR